MARTPMRFEDARLLTGAGRFIADLRLPGMAHAVVVRSPHAHALLNGIQRPFAPGLLAVLTADDVAADGLGGIPWEVAPPGVTTAEGDGSVAAPQTLLADRRVRYVGEPVALVVAERLEQARDAAERLAIEYEVLPAVTLPEAALAPGAPPLHARGNLCFRFGHGDAAATDAAFAGAAVQVRLRAVNQRLIAAPIECRGYVGTWEGGRWTLHAAAGKPHPIRRTLARFVFGVSEDQIRVLVGDVGGGFGAKNVLYAEAALVLWAAKRLGRPVSWQADRAETFQSDMQGRDHTSDAAMAFDAEGRIAAVRIATLANLGAWLGPRAVNPAVSGAKILAGTYHVPAGRIDVTGVHTNTVPTCPYRGAGAPEVIFLLERLMDLGARRLGLAPDEIRRRNLLPPDALPCPTIGGVTYADCDFPAVMAQALGAADWAGFPARRAEAAARGMLRGIGLSMSIEAYGPAVAEAAALSLDPEGGAELRIGTQSSGQSHATVYALLLAERLGIAADRVRVVQGDTDRITRGSGTGASRSLTVGGSATLGSAGQVVEAGRPVAAAMLEAAPADIVFETGGYHIAGTDRTVSLQEVVREAGGLSACAVFQPSGYNFPYGCHVAEIEIDPATGATTVMRYTAVQDSGRAVSPAVVHGQMHGGIAQGIGQALLEHCVFEAETGQLLSGSLMDYALPRCADLPTLAIALHELPTASNPIGAKAVGEAGPTGAPPAAINAIANAIGIDHIEMPATPERVWRAMGFG